MMKLLAILLLASSACTAQKSKPDSLQPRKWTFDTTGAKTMSYTFPDSAMINFFPRRNHTIVMIHDDGKITVDTSATRAELIYALEILAKEYWIHHTALPQVIR